MALPQRSPKPLMTPCTCVAPAATAASELATASSASLWQWMPSGTPTAARAARVASVTVAGTLPPRVSQRQSSVAPASAAACRQRSAYSGFERQPSKKCSASKITSSTRVRRYVIVSAIKSRLAASGMRRSCSTGTSQVRPTIVTTGVSAVSSMRTFWSSSQVMPCRRVEPKAAIFAWRSLRPRTASKKPASRGFEPGQPPST